MKSMAYLHFQILLLFVASKSTFSQDPDFNAIEQNLLNRMSQINSEIMDLKRGVFEVSSQFNNFFLQIERVSNNQNSLDSKLERVQSDVTNFNEATRNISQELADTKENILNNTNSLNSKLERVQSDVTNFNEATRNISQELADTKENILNNHNSLDSKLERVQSDITNFNEATRNISNELADTKEILLNNQNSLDSKLENLQSNITNFNEATRNISNELADAKDDLTIFFEDELFFQAESIKQLINSGVSNGTRSIVVENNEERNPEREYKFGIGESVELWSEKVCIKPVTNLTTRSLNQSPELFSTGRFNNYYDALRDCEIRGGVAFIPRTKTENDKWINYAKDTSRSTKIRDAFYPKIYYDEITRFLFADCKENSDYFKISIPKAQLNPVHVRRHSNSHGALCIKYRRTRFISDHCESTKIPGFAICEKV